jgi:hypothetical protein
MNKEPIEKIQNFETLVTEFAVRIGEIYDTNSVNGSLMVHNLVNDSFWDIKKETEYSGSNLTIDITNNISSKIIDSGEIFHRIMNLDINSCDFVLINETFRKYHANEIEIVESEIQKLNYIKYFIAISSTEQLRPLNPEVAKKVRAGLAKGDFIKLKKIEKANGISGHSKLKGVLKNFFVEESSNSKLV